MYNQKILTAINNHQDLLILYKDVPRVVRPYSAGLSSSSNKTFLHGLQIGNGTADWKTFDIDKIEALEIIKNHHFAPPANGYKLPQHISMVMAQI